jgi:secondary thiamine-phosphate synthase enzyme
MQSIFVETKGELDVVNVTNLLQQSVSGLGSGLLHVFLKSTTSGLYVNEDDPALIEDIRDFIKRSAPSDARYRHDATWGDGNGRSHVRSLLLDRSLLIPVSRGSLALGTWQSVFLVELDTRPRRRELVLTFIKADRRWKNP